MSVYLGIVKAWPRDPRKGIYVPLEVPEKLPQGQLACGSQAFLATLLFDPSISALSIIELQSPQRVGLFIRL